MIIVKEKKSVPHADVRCGNCGSLLQYGNADLRKESEICSPYSTNITKYYIICPVCGCEVNANWIIKKGEEV